MLVICEYLESARGDVRSPSLTAGEGAGSSQAAPSDGPSPVPQLTQDNAVAISKLVREIELNLTFSTGRREPELNTLPHNKKRTPSPPPPPSVSLKESSFVLDDYLRQLTGRSGAKLRGDVLETVFVDGEAVQRMVKRNLHGESVTELRAEPAAPPKPSRATEKEEMMDRLRRRRRAAAAAPAASAAGGAAPAGSAAQDGQQDAGAAAAAQLEGDERGTSGQESLRSSVTVHDDLAALAEALRTHDIVRAARGVSKHPLRFPPHSPRIRSHA